MVYLYAFMAFGLIALILAAIYRPLGDYMYRVYTTDKDLFFEKWIYRIIGVDFSKGQSWKAYFRGVLGFSVMSLLVLYLLQRVQSWLPFSLGFDNVPAPLAFNTAASFVTNTNWQSYSPDQTLGYSVQIAGLCVQNFVSAGTGIAVMFALIRGFRQIKEQGLGSFWVDLTRTVLYVLIPLNLVFGICLAAGGVISNFQPAQKAELVEPVAVQPNADGGWSVIDGAQIEGDTVKVDGKVVEGARVVTEQFLPQGPAAPQVAIKQSGTNGGGFFGVNSAHPYDEPSAFTNIIEMTSLLLIPAACCFTFGIGVKNTKQGKAIFAAMLILLVVFTGIIAVNEHMGTPQLADGGAVNIEMTDGQAGGNMEGKESRFGIASSSTWSAFTTAASNGSVNSMHDSYTPLGGFVQMLQMALGEVVFGGVGCGLYGMLAFAILTVFIAGLMVGRTPEFLGKKIEPYEMKWSVLVCLATPIAILVGSGLAAVVPSVMDSLHNGGAHGFSEMLYTYSSCGGNNGSAFAGFNGNTVFLNVSLGLVMLFARFLPIIGTLAIAGSLAREKEIATTGGHLIYHKWNCLFSC